jgi:hypothetical protein
MNRKQNRGRDKERPARILADIKSFGRSSADFLLQDHDSVP